MPALTRTEVVQALLLLGGRGVSIPPKVVGFALEEDFSTLLTTHPFVVASAMIVAMKETTALLERVR